MQKWTNITDKISNLILYLPNISRKIWLKSNPNKILRKSALWYATAHMIVLKDSIIGCISKVGPSSFQKQISKMLDENRLYQNVKEYLNCNNWIILGGQPARGTDHLPVIEVRDFANQIKGSKGTKKIDLVAFKSGFFLLCELHSSYSHDDIIKLNELTVNINGRQAFINSLLEKRILESNNITIPYQKYIDSERYLIKAIGHNMSNRSSPEGFVSFVMGESTVIPFCGNAVPYEVRQLFSCS